MELKKLFDVDCNVDIARVNDKLVVKVILTGDGRGKIFTGIDYAGIENEIQEFLHSKPVVKPVESVDIPEPTKTEKKAPAAKTTKEKSSKKDNAKSSTNLFAGSEESGSGTQAVAKETPTEPANDTGGKSNPGAIREEITPEDNQESAQEVVQEVTQEVAQEVAQEETQETTSNDEW